MKTKIITTAFFMSMLILLAQFVWVTPAFADDGTPLPLTEETATPLPPTEVPVVEVTATPEPVVTESSAEDLAPTEPAATEVTPETASTETPLLQELPADTSIVVVGENGEVLPLASQDAAEVMAIADPMWCPAGATTVTAACVNAATVGGLISLLQSLSKDGDGVIYFYTPTTYAVNDVTFSNTNLPLLADNSLTLQGGWNGVTTLDSTIALSGNSNFSVPVQFFNWNGAVTVNNITINNSSLNALLVTSSFGSSIPSQGDVTVSDSNFYGNSGDGLHVNSTGKVEIENSKFNSNFAKGLSVFNSNSVIIKNSEFNNNYWHGAYIDAAGNIQVDYSEFNGNYDPGLYILSNGNISTNNVTANNSITGYGAYINNTSSSTGATVTLTGTNTFNSNYNAGLYVLSDGNVSVNNVTANNSITGHGAYINNTTSSNSSSVTLTGINTFDGNYNVGLSVQSDGNIVANNVTASNNIVGAGVNFYNTTSSSAATITLAGSNVFTGNLFSGVYVLSNGNISIANVTANSNGRYGVYLRTGGVVTIANSYFNDNQINSYSGLAVVNSSNVAVMDSVFSGNYYGLNLYNTGSVFLTNNNVAYNCTGVYLGVSTATTVNGGKINNNVTGIVKVNSTSLLSLNGVTVSGNENDVTNVGVDCVEVPTSEFDSDTNSAPASTSTTVIIVASNSEEASGVAGRTEFEIDCVHQRNYIVILPNEDQVQVVCPVSGKAYISRLDNTALPGDLPMGYTYASAFSLDILQGDKLIEYIKEGGYINVSFDVPNLEAGAAYTLLYWDNGEWVPLKEFMLDETGNPRAFSLHPDDPRMVLSGLKLVFDNGVPRLELSTNFPGIFVLVQR